MKTFNTLIATAFITAFTANATAANPVTNAYQPNDGELSVNAAVDFEASNPENSQGGLIDNVSIEVPEPSSLMLLAFGALGLGIVRRRSRA